MLDISAAIPNILQRLEKIPVGHCLDLRTFKRNRSVIIVKREKEYFEIIENGFYQDRFQVEKDKLKKTLKNLLKKEFPRSNKIRVYKLEGLNESNIQLDHLKKL